MRQTQLLRTALMIIVMFVFIATGILKLMSSPQEVAVFINWGYPLWLMYLTGVLNIFFAIGLCIKKFSRISAVALVTLLATAIISSTLHHQSLYAFLPAIFLICALIAVLYIDKNIDTKGN